MSSLTPRAEWFVGLYHHRRRCSSSDRGTGARPVQRQPGSRGPLGPSQSEDRPRRRGLLSWGSSIAPPPTQPSCVHIPSKPSPGLRFGTATSRTCSVLAVPPGSNGFLRSDRIRRSARSTVRGFVAPRSRPWGSPRFGLLWIGLSTEPRPEGRRTRRSVGSRPLWRTPYEAFPSSVASPCRHRATSFRTRSRSPTGVPSRRSNPVRYCVATARGPCSSTSGRCSTEESVAMRATLPLRARSMLPWALDRLVPMLPRVSRHPVFRRDVSPGGPAASASLDPNVERRQWSSGLVWLRAIGPQSSPKGRLRPHAVAPAPPEGDASAASQHGPRRTVGCRWIQPREEVPPRRSEHPKVRGADVIATHLRRDSFATQRSLRRAASGGSSSCSPSFRGRPRT